jgi:hypothetical protein
MDRRSFLHGSIGLFLPSGKEADIDPNYWKIIVRTTMDTERLVYKQLGRKVTLADQIKYYEKAAKLVAEGFDPFEEKFWNRVDESDSRDLAGLSGMKGEIKV